MTVAVQLAIKKRNFLECSEISSEVNQINDTATHYQTILLIILWTKGCPILDWILFFKFYNMKTLKAFEAIHIGN